VRTIRFARLLDIGAEHADRVAGNAAGGVRASACGAKTGPKGQAGLKVRAWACSVCAAAHDRDVNAAA
jgi:hypothetical protein